MTEKGLVKCFKVIIYEGEIGLGIKTGFQMMFNLWSTENI